MLEIGEKGRQSLENLHSEECHELFQRSKLLFILKPEIYFLIMLIVSIYDFFGTSMLKCYWKLNLQYLQIMKPILQNTF